MISAIVAVDNNWGIGYNGKLLEHIPEDLKYFKELTTGNRVVMGRKTWNSLPINPLPDRINIVVTSNPVNGYLINGAFRKSLENTIKEMLMLKDECDYFIIGGGQIYKELLPYCDRVYVTKILKNHDNVDTYFPNLDKMSEWELDTCSDLRRYNDIDYAFMTYDRIS